MKKLYEREGKDSSVSSNCKNFLQHMLLCAEMDLEYRRKVCGLQLKDVVGEKNEWDD